ncbi:hypothetical protein LR48_Vigan08g096300 [Vigna angularis]|uniref:Neprosin PEP catalytic domain-containing protein n=1 Tax=Phaseolus angularis TaxID=3914 RepID=A0A0L9V542_PHAAN|nr:hypothetical protein LR48_Vigan08g096300 [Vigna angularis]
MLVARGTVYETATIVHGVQLAEDDVKVTVGEVVVPDVVLPVPTNEFFTVEGAFKSFVSWLRHLVGDVSDPPIGQEGSPTTKKTHLSEDDPLGALDELAKIISDASMIVHWDSTTFGREAHIPLYLHQQDVRELAPGREEINITLIQLWMMYMYDASNKKGFNDVYGFIDSSMTHERNKFDDIQTYITTCFGMGKEIYFLPYILGSLTTHMMLCGRSTATVKKLAWVALKRFNRTAQIPEKSLQLRKPSFQKSSTKNLADRSSFRLEEVQCPKGYIPVRRTTKEDLIREKQLLKNNIFVQDIPELALSSKYSPYYSVNGRNSIYNPPVTKGQMSLSHVWVQNGPIKTNNKISLGWQDPKTKNWWIQIDGTDLGYYPAKLFSNLTSADKVGWGGRTLTPHGSLSPQMGSGHFPDKNLYDACYFRTMTFENSSRIRFGPERYQTEKYIDKPKCYDLTYYGNAYEDAPGHLLYMLEFGGPGGKCDDKLVHF